MRTSSSRPHEDSTIETSPEKPIGFPRSTCPTTPIVTTLFDARVRGGRTGIVETLPLGEALQRIWSSDRHFQAAHAPELPRRRLTRADVGTTPILMTCLAIDIDGPDHEAPEAWRADTEPRLLALPGSPALYATRGGYRAIWGLAEPFVISSPADGLAWRARYLAILEWLATEHGVIGDRSCADWTRLHRLPLVIRDGQPQRLSILRDATAIGTIELPEVAAPEPKALAHQAPLLEGSPQGAEARLVEPGCAGFFGRLLDARGAIALDRDGAPRLWRGVDGVEAVRVQCPNRAAHGRGHGPTGDLALLFEGPTGRIVCSRSSCVGIEGLAWLAFFSVAERVAAGLRSVTVRRHWINSDASGRPRIALDVEAADGGPGLPYVRISAGTRTWDALFEACDLETPSGDDLADVRQQARGLIGARIALEVANGVVKRILEAGK